MQEEPKKLGMSNGLSRDGTDLATLTDKAARVIDTRGETKISVKRWSR